MKARYTLLFALLFLSLSSCIELTEQMRLKENGSGHFTFTLDMSEAEPLFNLLSSFGDEEEDTKAEVRADLDDAMNDAYDKLKDMRGIRNPVVIESNSGLLTGISFEFENIEALNDAMNEIIDEKEDGKPKYTTYFSYKNGQLQRENALDLEKRIKAETDGELPDIDLTINGQSLQGMLKSMRYRTEYTFDKPVKQVSNQNAVISKDGRTVSLDYYFLDEHKGNNTLANRISY